MQQVHINARGKTQKSAAAWRAFKLGMRLCFSGIVIIVTFILLAMTARVISLSAVLVTGMGILAGSTVLLIGFIYILIICIKLYRKLHVGIGLQVICASVTLMVFLIYKLCRIYVPVSIDVVEGLAILVLMVLFCFTIPAIVFIVQGIMEMRKKNNIP